MPFIHAVNDPLVNVGGVKARLGSEMLSAMAEAMSKAPSFKLPCLILHGEKDTLALPAGSSKFFQLAGTKKEDKTEIIYKGMRHEIFNESDNTPVQDVVAWVQKQHSTI